MSGQSGGQRLRVSMLNEHLTCKLCGGYFIDATTIIECLHSFCKSCIVKYLESNKFCPVCDAQVHKNKPLLNIRPDQILQDIVYKLVPGCYQNEMRCRKEFYTKNPDEKSNVTLPEAKGEPVESYIYSPDESLSLSLEYFSPEAADEIEKDKETTSKQLPRRYLRCPAAVTVYHLQKLIRAKYGLSEVHRVDIMYKEEPLCSSYTLMDIMYIYHWRRKVPLHLSYRIFESASKRLKLSEDNDEFKQSLSNSNMEVESKDEQSLKREWKEVQLKISETGVMSVTDISNLDAKKSTKINEINQQISVDQAASNCYNVNKTVVKTEEKDPIKSCTAPTKNKKVQQESSAKKSEQTSEEKPSIVSLSAIPTCQNNSKSEDIDLKSVDQHGLSNELKTRTNNEKCDNECSKTSSDSAKTSGSDTNNQVQKGMQSQDKIKIEPPSTPEKRTEVRQNSTNNNFISNETKAENNAKPTAKPADSKSTPSAGSKINALSAKLQFQPKVGQVNNTYSKKSTVQDKKISPSPTAKLSDTKLCKISPKVEVKPDPDAKAKIPISSVTTSVANVSIPYSQNSALNASSTGATYVTAPSASIDTCATSANFQQQQQQHSNALHSIAAPSTESLASIGLHVSTTMTSPASINSWMAERNSKSSAGKALSPEQLRSIPGMPQIGKDIVCSTTAANPTSSMGRFSIQTPSMSIYSINSSMKNNVYPSSGHGYTSPSKQSGSSQSSAYGTSSMYPVPPCPDAIPISLMKPANPRKDAASKGSTLNEICAKISNASTGSKINDICAKIGENSKEKNKIEAQRSRPEVPDLLKISKKSPTTPTSENPTTSTTATPAKHIPNIPNVPIYTPSNSQQPMQPGADAKDTGKRLASAIAPSQAALVTGQSSPMAKMPVQKKHSHKTLRDPPKLWNPTLSNNDYVAAKNQAKELQNQAQTSYGTGDASGTSKPIPSKPAKIFKNRNMPRFLGAPTSGVKPMYGVNEQAKEKEQSASSKSSSPTVSVMKIDPQTLSPIVSPPPYSPTARNYQNSPFGRDICRNNSSPISPRNSPVNLLSTSPFIPSHTPNTNPRHFYPHFPPAFADSSRFSDPLIRSTIQPPSAFHSSLPPSIIKLYRSGYMTQPQTSVAPTFSANAAGQHPPAVQRMPASSHASPVPATASSPSSTSRSPKTSSTAASPASASPRSEAPATSATTTSTAPVSVLGNVALQLAKDLAQRDSSLYDLTRADSLLKSGAKASGSSQGAPDTPTKQPQQQSSEPSKSSEPEIKPAVTSTKEPEKKDKGQAKVNGGIAITMPSGEKPKDAGAGSQVQQQQAEPNKPKEGKAAPEGVKVEGKISSPTKTASGKPMTTQAADKIEAKHEADVGKAGTISLPGKKAAETTKGKVES